MADGIHGIGYGSTSGVGGGYVPQRNNEDVDDTNNSNQVQPNYEETQVDPQKVMDFLANNNYFIPLVSETAPVGGVSPVDAEVADRVAGYMEVFEQIYAIVEEEFGVELAPAVMDLVMDKLIGMA